MTDDSTSMLLGEVSGLMPKDDKAMYWVYVMYGFSVLSIFNAFLSCLDYFIAQMGDYNPTFYLTLGLNTFVIIMMYFGILYGKYFSFTFRNNVMILIQIPITIGVIFLCKYLPD